MKKVSKITEYSFVVTAVIVILGLSSLLWLNRYTTISFLSDSTSDIVYTIPASTSGKGHEAITVQVPAGTQQVEIRYPIKHLEFLKLSISSNQPNSTIRISDLTVKGRETYKITDFAGQCNLNQPESMRSSGSELIIHTGNSNGFSISSKENINIRYVRHVDWLIFFSVLVIGGLLSIRVVHYIIRFKKTENASKKDLVLVTLFFSSLMIPMSAISDAEISTREQRTLAKKPSLDKLFERGYNYGALFDKWFSDRFFGRDYLISLHSFLNFKSAQKGNSEVRVGLDNWLFLLSNNNMEDFFRTNHLQPNELTAISNYLSDINKWCKANGKEFYYFIAPNKHNVYDKYYGATQPSSLERKSRAEELIAHLQKNTDIKVIYPLAELREASNSGYTYYKHDTHWTQYGANIGYSKLMDEICKKYPITRFTPTFEQNASAQCDLETLLPECKKDSLTYLRGTNYDSANITVTVQSPNETGNGSINTIENPSKSHGVFMLRDSFSSSLIPFMRSTFGKLRVSWNYQITQGDLDYIKDNADIVIMEQVERLVPLLQNCQFPKQ